MQSFRWYYIAIAVGLAWAAEGCDGSGSSDSLGSASVEEHCGTSDGSSGCRCNQYCQKTGCGMCRSASSGLVAEPPAAAQTNCVNGMAGIYPCHNVDLMAFLPLSQIGGGTGNDIWGWTDSLTGKEYALMGRSTGTAFVDISNPAQPIYLGNLPTHNVASLWRGIKVYADHAFIGSEAAGHGLQVFDLKRLRNVPNPPATFNEDAWYSGFSNSHNIAVNESSGFVYATGTNTCNGGLHIVDVHNPVQPIFAGCVGSDGYVHDAQCVVYGGPDAQHVGKEICFNSNEDTVTIVDVSLKNAPVQLSRTGYPGAGYTHQGWLTADHRYFLHDDETDEIGFGHFTHTYVWDMSDLNGPVFLGSFTSSRPSIDHNLYIRDGHAFESNYRAGLRVLRLGNLSSLELNEVGYFDIYPPDDEPAFNGAWNNFPFYASGTVVVSGIEQGLYILRPDLDGAVQTPTPLRSSTPTRVPTATRTRTPTIVRSPSATRTRSLTRTATRTRTRTVTRLRTATRTATRTKTPTRPRTATRTRTPIRPPTFTRTRTATRTKTVTRTRTPTRIPTRTRTPTA